MSARRIIPETVLRLQIEASNPAVSAWVAANAGSGKTYVLAQRVIRLLLGGVEPEKILCITFTKAAAANMAKRVFDTLSAWTALDDAALDDAIHGISKVTPDAALRARARRLFALALETPGGLKVQTIHAFCTRILHQFPFEADVAAKFEVLDSNAESQLLEEVTMRVLLDASAAPESALGKALAAAIATVADVTFKAVISEAIGKRDVVRDWIAHGGSIDAAIGGLCAGLGIATHDSIERIDHETTEGPLLPSSAWAGVAAVLDGGSKTDQQKADLLRAAMQASGDGAAERYRRVFLNADETPRKAIVTKAIEKANPGLADRMMAERDRVVALMERRKAVVCRDRTAALVTIADDVIGRYQTEKERRGLLDYDDLIEKTLAMLDTGKAAWVHFKLDRGVDHVLIDEAQDTSPQQWRIIQSLVGEFFAGAGARSVPRTVFAVGDEKQSIFSFQGAVPREFDAMKQTFAKLCRNVDSELRALQFGHSFRSGENVLGAVDAVFAAPGIAASVTSDTDGIPEHFALPEVAPGLVEIWETVRPPVKREIEAWDAPFDDVTESSASARLALKIATNVRHWCDRGTSPGDVLVLVRQRGPLFEAIIRSLKDKQIAVAGADRLVLTEHIAVMDLLALADALLLQQDDLALATVLKSPLFGFDDDDLFAIAWQRKGSLRAALRAKTEVKFTDAAAKLDRFADWARRGPPFAFYARVLGAAGGRRQFLARLGFEAEDAIDEFLNLSLDYERRETPSLQGFAAWLRTARTDVKRDMEITRDQVRVMTVHGAKGLEARVVILADTTTPPAGPVQRQPKLLTLPIGAVPGTPDGLVWIAAKATDCDAVGRARVQALRESEDEHRRLLYVAMTRAIERLVVCGYEGERKRPDGCWYDLVFNALGGRSQQEPSDDGDGQVWRYRKHPGGAGEGTAALSENAGTAPSALPAWLMQAVAVEPGQGAALSPSRAYDEVEWSRGPGSGLDRKKAMKRGSLVHRLLQSLPELPNEARVEAARRHLNKVEDFDLIERAEILDQVMAILDAERFAGLFGSNSRAEVPIVGRLALGDRTVAVSGLVDRLTVTSDTVLIADYKTNRPAPRRLEKVPRAYVRQLALYRAILALLYPDKAVRAALIWTDIPDVMEVPHAAMDAELAALTAP
jgi:ATP-dependent helicase/nuclease subunit A